MLDGCLLVTVNGPLVETVRVFLLDALSQNHELPNSQATDP